MNFESSITYGEENFWLDRFPSVPRADQKKSHLCFALFSTNADLGGSFIFRFRVKHIGCKML